MKKFIAMLLCVLMVVPQAVVGTLATALADAGETVIQSDATLTAIEAYELGTVIEGKSGDYTDRNSDHMYYRYNPYHFVKTVNLIYSDGSSELVDYHDIYDECTIEMVQDYDNQWTAGNIYSVTMSYRGVSCGFGVYIIPTDIDSIEILETTSFVEGQHLKKMSEYVDGEWIEYEVYEVFDAIVDGMIKVNYKDGSSENVRLWNDYHDTYFAFASDQSDTNVWTAGNTYTATLYYYGVSCDFDITITEDPVDYVEVYESKVLREGYDGHYGSITTDAGTHPYYWYDAADAIESVRIAYKDGTEKICSLRELESYSVNYEGSYYQSQTPWVADNYYDATLNVGTHSCDFKAHVVSNNIASVEVYETAALVVGKNSEQQSGYDEETGEWLSYDHYNLENAVKSVKLTYTDGTSEIVPFERYGEADNAFLSDQSYQNRWTAGNTYFATLYYACRTCEFEVSVVDDPIASIEVFETKPIYENVNGWWRTDYSEELGCEVEFFQYYPWDAIVSVKINYTDGTSEILDYNEWRQDNDASVYHAQSVYNQWIAGNTYTATLNFEKHSCDFEVKIESHSVTDIEFPNLVGNIREGSYGSWASQNVDGEWKNYFVYDLTYNIGWITVHYSDGSTANYFSSDEIVNIETNQNYFNQWVGGNTYLATVTVDGYSEDISFYIEPTNVESFEILETKPIYEGDGYIENYYDEELDEYVDYIFYSAWDVLDQIKVYYKDGTSEICNHDDLGRIVGGTVYMFSNQGAPDNIWTVGNTYTASLSCGMFDAEFEISIIENPIESIEVVETKPIDENTNGWYNGYWDENDNYCEYFFYNVAAAVQTIKINYKDGTSEVVDRSELDSWSCSSVQNENNQWTVGNTYTATFKYMGMRCEFEVTITPFTPYNYMVQDGNAYITGLKNPLYYEENGITDVVIPSEVQGYPVVGINTMSGSFGAVESITIPASVKYLSSWCLSSFYNVKTVYIEGTETVLSIPAFHGMDRIEEFVVNEAHPDYTVIDGVVFDKDVTTIVVYPMAKGYTYELPVTISDFSFREFYPNVNFIIHPDSKEFVVENGITYNKDKTQILACDKTVSGEYVMPETVEYITEMVFRGCDNLTSVVMSPLVTNIAYATFDNCPNLTNVVLPTELQTIGACAFSDCSALESIELPSNLLHIENKAFYNTGLKSLLVPGSVIYVGAYSFMNSQLETIVTEDDYYEDAFGEICSYAFANNENLKNVVFGEGFVAIGSRVFADCVSLAEINIPDSAVMFGEYIFENCDALTYLPIGANQDHIPTGEFYDCNGLVNVTIPDQVVAILSNAFRNCTNLKTVGMPDELTYMERYIFAGCTSLTELPLSANQQYIAYGEFSGCTGLVNVQLPERITEICAYAFSNCTNLTNVNFSDNINYIDRGAFQGCSSLKNAYIGKDVLEINMYTFKNSGITDVVIGENVQSIGYEAFMNSKLTSVDIPASVTEIAYFAFFGCEDLININMPDTLVELGGHSFGATKWYNNKPEGMVYLGTSLYNYKGDIPEGAELYVKPGTLAIAGHAFENGCTDSWFWDYDEDERYHNELYDRSGLKSIHIPEGVEVIGDHAFYNCSGLKEVYLPASLTFVNLEAFYLAHNIETVYYGGTEEQWNNIELTEGNSVLHNCEVVFNYVDGEYPAMPDTTLNGWHEFDGKWYFYENDMAVMSQWRKDSNGWCYLGDDGAMATNTWVMDSKGWCYIGANGYAVTNCWKMDSVGWCYLDSEGSQVKNSWINDGGLWYFVDADGYMMANAWIYEPKGWVYLGENGAMVVNKWVKDSVGWVYLDNSGYMVTNSWVRDSIGWCYVGANGYAVTNCWKQDSQGWCYLNSEGSMTINSWVNDGGVWYYLNANGYMLSNTWFYDGSVWYYFTGSGAMVTGWNLIGGVWYNFASNGVWIG